MRGWGGACGGVWPAAGRVWGRGLRQGGRGSRSGSPSAPRSQRLGRSQRAEVTAVPLNSIRSRRGVGSGLR